MKTLKNFILSMLFVTAGLHASGGSQQQNNLQVTAAAAIEASDAQPAQTSGLVYFWDYLMGRASSYNANTETIDSESFDKQFIEEARQEREAEADAERSRKEEKQFIEEARQEREAKADAERSRKEHELKTIEYNRIYLYGERFNEHNPTSQDVVNSQKYKDAVERYESQTIRDSELKTKRIEEEKSKSMTPEQQKNELNESKKRQREINDFLDPRNDPWGY